MPVKRRVAKRRADEVEQWQNQFETGCDFFQDLRRAGVPLNRIGDATDEAAREAWRRLGADYLAKYGREKSSGGPAWALEKFGEPDAC